MVSQRLMSEAARVARAAAAEAGSLMRARWRTTKKVEFKGTVDLVTQTDREAEALVVRRLRRAFPDHLIVAEEASAGDVLRAPSAERFVWYLDPLDGTTNFAHAYPQFCVSLALYHGAHALLGIVYAPIHEETFFAVRGAGAMLNGKPIQVSATTDLGRALLGTGFPYDRRERADFYLSFVADFLKRALDVRRGGSAAIDLCYVACGRFDGFWEYRLHPWDTAAATLIVREAGGMVSDFHGRAFDLYGEQTLASNGRVHGALVRVLKKRLAATVRKGPVRSTK
jgi:myo-inositol-1(or 4)-monophosphatase